MIHDGYTFTASYQLPSGEDATVMFRPMLWWQRRAVLDFINHHDTISSSLYLIHAIKAQVISSQPETNCIEQLVPIGCEGGNTIIQDIVGFGSDDREFEDEKELSRAAESYWQNPSLDKLTCDYCQKYIMNPVTGENTGYERGPEDILLCKTHAGCPKGSPENEWTPSWRHWQALTFHKICQLHDQWPIDPIVQRNKSIINNVYQKAILEYDSAKH